MRNAYFNYMYVVHRTSSNCACSSITSFFLSERDFKISYAAWNRGKRNTTGSNEHLRSYRELLCSPATRERFFYIATCSLFLEDQSDCRIMPDWRCRLTVFDSLELSTALGYKRLFRPTWSCAMYLTVLCTHKSDSYD